ncbi:phosphatase 2C-like domain-containing protein [Xylariales sp. PMI_506]|nr:phosphatase 2C-like domain-containing protein [Xylariales sp. PMI_506]
MSLVSYVVRELKAISPTGLAEPSIIDKAIQVAFLKLDDDIVNGALRAIRSSNERGHIVSRIVPATAGSTAVLAMYDTTSSALRVASVGDSRAVLGNFEGAGNAWSCSPLSVDQTPSVESEKERILAAHPNEPNVIARNRVLGLPMTRAFGDHRWKWPAEDIALGRAKFFSAPARPHYHTPPYLTAEPVITTTTIKPGDFAILATDGVWSSMSSENAVACIGSWIKETSRRAAASEEPLGALTDAHAPSDRVEGVQNDESQIGDAWGWEFRPQDMVLEDANAATHLIRNALGGNRREQLCTVLGVPHPQREDARDDMTAQVIFFGDIVEIH